MLKVNFQHSFFLKKIQQNSFFNKYLFLKKFKTNFVNEKATFTEGGIFKNKKNIIILKNSKSSHYEKASDAKNAQFP